MAFFIQQYSMLFYKDRRKCTVYRGTGADPGLGVGGGGEIRQGDLRVLLLLSKMFMERMMQENQYKLAGYYDNLRRRDWTSLLSLSLFSFFSIYFFVFICLFFCFFRGANVPSAFPPPSGSESASGLCYIMSNMYMIKDLKSFEISRQQIRKKILLRWRWKNIELFYVLPTSLLGAWWYCYLCA